MDENFLDKITHSTTGSQNLNPGLIKVCRNKALRWNFVRLSLSNFEIYALNAEYYICCYTEYLGNVY